MAKRLLQFIEDNIEDAINEIMPKEDIHYLLDFQIVPTQQGPQPVVFIVLTIPSGIINNTIFKMVPMPLGLSEDLNALKSILREVWLDMQAQRAEALGTSAPINASSRLLLPGQ